MNNGIRVCIADDHTLFRKAIVNLLKSFARVSDIADAENGKELLTLVKYHKPDVALVDLQMPVMDGIETCEKLIEKFPELKLIVLTMHDSDKYILHMIEMGVHAFLLKNTEPDELERAIYSVFDRDFYHNDLVASVLRKSVREKVAGSRPSFVKHDLSDREKEVLKLICQELSVHEIAIRLSISDNTVRNHRANIMAKASTHTVVGLVRYAYQAGIID